MKSARSLFVIGVGLVVCAVAALNAEAAGLGRRVDPNADHIPSPFRGAVVSANATSLVVKGDVKTRGWQSANGEPRPAPGQQAGGPQAKETSVSHTVTFVVKPDIKVTRDGKAAQLKDIHPGDAVSVTFSVKEGSSLKHVSEVAISSTGGFADAQDQPKGDKKKSKQ